MKKPQAESREAAPHPSLRPARTVCGIKTTTPHPRPKASQDLIVLQEGSRPTSKKMVLTPCGSSLRNEATAQHRLKEEAGNWTWQRTLSLECWPFWTSHPFGTPPWMPLVARVGGIVLLPAWAPASALSSILLRLPCF
ncbi:protein FAM27L-like [Sapajus apella]|uniref:Protein FAM27L-like n=1 Tax=Sapajus apella TaxID=9515 RepID=A0A6J3FIC4_SAPAP|nr:protein FAM27L-like [Sapajus apella]